MASIEDLNGPPAFRRFLRENFAAMVRELVDIETQIISNYRNNPTLPFDYYNAVLRDISTKITCKREVYLRLTGEKLD